MMDRLYLAILKRRMYWLTVNEENLGSVIGQTFYFCEVY